MSGLVNPSPSSGPTLVSHQTGLSITSSAANAVVNIGTAITFPRNGIMRIQIFGHVSANSGQIDFTLTRGTTTYYFLQGTSTSLGGNYAGFFGDSISTVAEIGSTVPNGLFPNSNNYLSNLNNIPVLNGDVLQFRAANNTAADLVYIDDVVVMLE